MVWWPRAHMETNVPGGLSLAPLGGGRAGRLASPETLRERSMPALDTKLPGGLSRAPLGGGDSREPRASRDGSAGGAPRRRQGAPCGGAGSAASSTKDPLSERSLRFRCRSSRMRCTFFSFLAAISSLLQKWQCLHL